MPPDTPTTTVRPRSMASLLREFFVQVRHLATNRALERRRRDLARHVLARLARPLVEAPRFARGHDGQFVLVRSQRRNQRSQLHGEVLSVTRRARRALAPTLRRRAGARAPARHPRWR